MSVSYNYRVEHIIFRKRLDHNIVNQRRDALSLRHPGVPQGLRLSMKLQVEIMFAPNPVGACGPLYFSARKLTNNKVEAFGMKFFMKKKGVLDHSEVDFDLVRPGASYPY
jgi:hypothetical protein